MEKSVDAFRTISEVADDLDLPQHVLRFWETRFAQIRPLKRAGGRRYYRPADIVLLRSIRQLLYDEGYTIKGVQRLLKEKGPRVLREDLPNGSEPAAFDAAESADGNPPDDLLEPRLAPDLPMDEPGETSGPVSAGQADETDAPAFDRDALWKALATIEECERILKAVRHPCS